MGLLRVANISVAGFLMHLLFTLPVHAQAPEYQVKAAMLYKFGVFVEWPAKAFSSPTSPFTACIMGKDPFGTWLQQELGETRVGTHPVEIRHIGQGQGVENCHMVFISASEEPRLPEMLPPGSAAALIVSDVSDINKFCRLGGMIGLVMEGAKVRFRLNSKAIAQAGLQIDSKLKRVALSADCGE